MGRPTKLTEEVERTIIDALREGNYLETAASLAGVTSRSVRDWIRRGAAGEEPFARFAEAADRARAEAEQDDLATVKGGVKEVWRAAAWRLERRNPKRWGQKIHMTVRQELDAFFAALDEEFAGDEDEEVLARIYRVAAEVGRGDAGEESFDPAAHYGVVGRELDGED